MPEDQLTETQKQNRQRALENVQAGRDPNAGITAGDIDTDSRPLRMPREPQQGDLRSEISSVAGLLNRFNEEVPQEQTQDDIQRRILSTMERIGERGQVQQQAEQEAELPGMRQRLQDISGQLQQLEAQSLAIPMQIQEEFRGRGATQGGVEPIEASRLRKNAIQSLSLSAQGQALQGNIELAQSQVNRAVDLEFEPMEVRLQTLQQMYQMNRDELERIDSQRATELQVRLSERQRLLDSQKEERRNIMSTAADAASLGIPQSIVDSITESASYEEAFEKATPFISQRAQEDRRAQQVLQDLEIRRERVAIENAKQEMSLRAFQVMQARSKEQVDAANKREAAAEKALSIYSLAQELTDPETGELAPGGDAAIGAGFGKTLLGAVSFGIAGQEGMAGTSRANFEARAERLANLLTLDNLKLMSGVLSETDIRILESAGSTLKDFDQSEKQYKEELARVIDVAERNFTKEGVNDEQASFWFGVDETDINDVNEAYGLQNEDNEPVEFSPELYYN